MSMLDKGGCTPEVQGKGPSPVQLHLGNHMVDMPSQEFVHQHASLVHVACKPRILPQGQLTLCLLPCSASGCRLQIVMVSVLLEQKCGNVTACRESKMSTWMPLTRSRGHVCKILR